MSAVSVREDLHGPSDGAHIERTAGIIRVMVTTLKARRNDRLGDIEGSATLKETKLKDASMRL